MLGQRVELVFYSTYTTSLFCILWITVSPLDWCGLGEGIGQMNEKSSIYSLYNFLPLFSMPSVPRHLNVGSSIGLLCQFLRKLSSFLS